MSSRIVIAGGTGFIGRHLSPFLLQKGHEVVVLTRSRNLPSKSSGAEMVQWDGRTIGPWIRSLDGAAAVVNLAGENIGAKRWSAARKAEIIDSRIGPTSAIVDGIKEVTLKPQVLVNISAVGFYGERGDEEVTEQAEKRKGFLADTVDRWEDAARKVERLGVRLVILRNGVVLGRSGGALPRMVIPFRIFIGGPIGSGRQWFPWIHMDDLLEIIWLSIHHESVKGVFNAVSPGLMTMGDVSKTIGKTLHRPSWIPVPAFILRLMLGEMSDMILGSQKVLPARLAEVGFRFRYPTLGPALSSILSS